MNLKMNKLLKEKKTSKHITKSQQYAFFILAFKKFFKGEAKFPKFKKKTNGGSFNIPQNVRIIDGKLIIPKFTKKNGRYG
jgi:transposase